MIEKSEAIRLADYLEGRANDLQTWVDDNEYVEFGYRPDGLKREQSDFRQIATELRRLHDDNRRLVNTLNHVSEVRSLLVEQRDELLDALQGLVAIATDSDGVAGYHLNGDIAEWASFPEWHEAHAAIAKAKGEQR